ncbi:uncharacterized protein LOC143773764 [Ranitomeya variabilis]|uniref:uncharacterized protein LOC143773764 n=1 Tax=Ranitomeya variabilis TaxID=490064 RepID=UPI0040577031
MAASSDEQNYSKIISSKSAEHPENGRKLQGKLSRSTDNQSNTPDDIKGRPMRAAEVILPRCVLQDVPKRPLPSKASSDGEPDITIDDEQAPAALIDPVIFTPQNEDENNSAQLILDPETTSFSKSSETGKVCTDEILCSSVCAENIMMQSITSLPDVNSICKEREDSDLSGRASFCSSLDRSCITPFSQLLSSSSSLTINMICPSRSEATFKNGSSRVTNQEEKSFLSSSEYDNNVLSPGLHSSSYLGNPNLGQASSHSLRISSQTSNFASSFDEMWHDRFLHHWPVLPPISPQRG